MSKKLSYDNIVVVKTRITCWDNDRPEDEESEIIELGLSLLNLKSMRVHGKRQFFVRPMRSSVSEYCENKTGITNKVLEKGYEFEEVCDILKEVLRTHKRPWAAFGESERKILEKQCREFDVPFPFTSRFINIQMMVPVIFGLTKELNFEEALSAASVSKEERQSGADDAWNAAHILKEVIVGGVASSY